MKYSTFLIDWNNFQVFKLQVTVLKLQESENILFLCVNILFCSNLNLRHSLKIFMELSSNY